MSLPDVVREVTANTLQIVSDLDGSDYTMHRLKRQTQIMEASLLTFQKYGYSTISALKRKRNSLLPVSKLPSDILATVVWISLPSRSLAAYKRLADLSLVSIDWHDMIENDPKFWSFLLHKFPEPLFRKILLNSALLDVTLEWHANSLPFEEELLQSHRRWKTLKLKCAPSITDRLVTVAAPLALEALSLHGRKPMGNILPFPTAPSLRNLRLHDIAMDWNTFQYTNLEYLELESLLKDQPPDSTPNCISLLQILGIIGQNTKLRVLDINLYGLHPTVDGPDEDITIPRVDLPNLERLYISAPCHLALLIMGSIKSRPVVSFQLILWWRDKDDLNALTLEAASAVAQKAMPAMLNAAALKLHYTDYGFLLIYGFPYRPDSFRLIFREFPMQHAVLFIRLVTKCLSPHPIPISLSITSWWIQEDVDETFSTMTQLPEVRKLRFNETVGNICPLMRRLGRPLPLNKDNHARWPFPHMTSFILERGECTVKHVVEMLQARYTAREPGGEPGAGAHENMVNVPLPLEELGITRKKANKDRESQLRLEALIGKERIRYL